MELTSHPRLRRCASKAGSSCLIFAAAELLRTSRHHDVPSMGPACKVGRSVGGISFSMARSRSLESRVSAVSMDSVGDSCVACCNVMAWWRRVMAWRWLARRLNSASDYYGRPTGAHPGHSPIGNPAGAGGFVDVVDPHGLDSIFLPLGLCQRCAYGMVHCRRHVLFFRAGQC